MTTRGRRGTHQELPIAVGFPTKMRLSRAPSCAFSGGLGALGGARFPFDGVGVKID
jgi:hypothetical protein